MMVRTVLVADAVKYGLAIPPASSMPEFIAGARKRNQGRRLSTGLLDA
jgi:hypothetical protein